LQHAPSKKSLIDIPSSIPKGDPSLGKRLEHLSKEERKKRKALDADRIARRLAKKRVKAAVEKAGGNHRDTDRTRKRTDPKKVVAVSKPKKLRSTTSQRNRNR
jgi:nucleolar protein 12